MKRDKVVEGLKRMYESNNGSKFIRGTGWTVIPIKDKLRVPKFNTAFKDPRNTLMCNGRFACSIEDKVTLLRYAKGFKLIVYWIWMGQHESHVFDAIGETILDRLIDILQEDKKLKTLEKIERLDILEERVKALSKDIYNLKYDDGLD